MTHTVVGLFDNRSEAQAAMRELVQHGFVQEDIDLSNRSMADTTNTTNRTTSEDTGIGDSISNFFSSLFGDDPATAQNYTNAAYDADAILTVQVDSAERAREASEIFDRHGAIDIDEKNAQYSQQNFAGSSETRGSTGASQHRANLENETAIPVIEEELQVGKRAVERGGARIRSRIIEKPVEASVRLREEHIVVNRHPVNREVTESDLNNFREGDIEITERAEVPVVGKQARVVEEVEVGKTVEEHEETVRDTVRRTDVDVEEIKGTDEDKGHTGTRRATN